MDLSNKRSSLRFDSNLPVTLLSEQIPGKIGLARNVSLGGICFESDVNLPLGEQITLQLSTLAGMIELPVVVRRKKENQYGCEFAEVNLESAGILSQSFFPAYEP